MSQTQEIPLAELRDEAGSVRQPCSDLKDYHLNSADAAEKLNDLDRLLSIVIHQIRNHCMSIKGYTSILNHEEGMSERGQKWLSKISRGIVSLENFLADFEKYRPSRVQNRQNIKIKHMVRHVWSLLENILGGETEGIELEIDVEEEAHIITDRSDFVKMLYQLMKNSIESMETGGKINLEFKYLGDEGETERWMLEIRDNGCGMNEQELKRAGEILHSVKQSHIGCGLNLVSAVAERIGAGIEIKSAGGAGTAVRILKNND
ncbi:MAG: hypothetical protein GF417_03215 [Candidatus Latescibacteria bacterium]|nr:hypothetical protein [bacterium]MBD3423439.1 hypothetical protein [Candidatus Latescibacterota bacterium]